MSSTAAGKGGIATIVVVAVLLFFLAAPIGALLMRVAGDGTVPAAHAVYRVLRFSLSQAIVSAGIAIVLAFPVAYAVSHYRFPGRRLIVAASMLPFVLPSIIVVVAMVAFFGRNGTVNRLFGMEANLVYSFAGIVLAHVYYNVSLAVRVLSAAWSGIDRRYGETARSLGDSRPGSFLRVTLPLLRPAVSTAFTLVFLYSFLSFGVVLVFGGVRYATLEVAIYREFFIDLDFRSAAVFAAVQLGFTVLFVAAFARSIHADRAGVARSDPRLPRLADASPATRLGMVLYLLIFAVFLGGPLATLIGRVAADPTVFRDLFVPRPGARSVEKIVRSTVPGVILRSVAIAFVSGTATFALSAWLALSHRGKGNRLFETTIFAPMGVSVVSVALGLRLLWEGIVPMGALVVVGQVVVTLPIVFRIVRAGVEELGDRFVQAARVLGASRFAVFRDVELPLLRRTFANAFAYAMALSFADITMVLGVGRGRIATFPVAIYRLIGFRSFDLAVALSVIYIGMCAALFLLIDATTERRSDR